jgi:succinyl-CoA synthetase beta subunit
MMLLEYEGKALLRSVGIRVPDGLLIESSENVLGLLRDRRLNYPVAVKAQVESGGRGKAGGVLRADSEQQAVAAAAQLFRSQFNGVRPRAVLIEPWLTVERELYLSVIVDRAAGGYVVLFSAAGGMDVEEAGRSARYPIGPPWRFRSHELRMALETTEIDFQTREKVIALAQRLVATASSHDCTTIEVNPLARLPDGDLVALDAKVVIDEWAAFRNRTIFEHKQSVKERAPELLRDCLAMKHMYVQLDGDIGLISGGAGMTMAAMDLIQEFGGKPACFLDCSPGPASARGYHPAFALLDGDARVRVILVSVYGGGTDMQRVARGMMEVMRDRANRKPVVFRLNGTHVEQVPAIFAESGAKNHSRLEDAVTEAIALARGTHEYSA